MANRAQMVASKSSNILGSRTNAVSPRKAGMKTFIPVGNQTSNDFGARKRLKMKHTTTV